MTIRDTGRTLFGYPVFEDDEMPLLTIVFGDPLIRSDPVQIRMSPDRFTCDACGGTFDKGPMTDDAAAAECQETFGVAHQPDDAVFCDDCYQKLLAEGDARGIPRRQPGPD